MNKNSPSTITITERTAATLAAAITGAERETLHINKQDLMFNVTIMAYTYA